MEAAVPPTAPPPAEELERGPEVDEPEAGSLWLRFSLPLMAIVADLLAVAAGFADTIPLDDRPKALIVLGLVGTVVPVVYLLAGKKISVGLRIAAVLATGAGVITMASGVYLAVSGKPPTSSTRNEASRDGGGRIVSPVAGKALGRCVRVQGVGHPRPGHEFRIGVSADPQNIWITRTPEASKAPGYDWYAWALYLGGVDDLGASYRVHVYEVPVEVLAEYDAPSSREAPHDEGKLEADGLVLNHSVDVTRLTTRDNSCSSDDDGITVPRP